MEGSMMRRARFAAAAAALILLVSAMPAAAHPPGPPRPAGPDRSGIQFRMGGFWLDADGGFWDDTEEVFTLDSDDFDGWMLGFTYLFSVNNHLDVGFNLDLYEETVRSGYRDWVDEFGYPILHDTQLSLVPMTADVRVNLMGRHRIRPGGRYIVQPLVYVGAGAGMVAWEYEEVGDFLDFSVTPDPEIFYDRFVDDGLALEAHVLAGVELPVGPSVNLLFETRYSLASDELGGDFSDLYERDIDLGGYSAYGGISFRF
jgi:hypothetical protein